jgi:hypothetical protein
MHSSVAFAELHFIFFLIAVRSVEGLHWGAEPSIDLGAALQAYSIPSELHRTQAQSSSFFHNFELYNREATCTIQGIK